MAQTKLTAELAGLAACCEVAARALAHYGPPPPRSRMPGLKTLAQVITSQQISVHAAAAIFGRLEVKVGPEFTADRLLALSDADFREVGFSATKVKYARDLAEHVADGRLDLGSIEALDDDGAIAAITQIKGFGRWSAEIYLMFAEGRGDLFPVGDLALRVGAGRLFGLDARPTEKQTAALIAHWSPHRTAGSLLVWHYYGATTLQG